MYVPRRAWIKHNLRVLVGILVLFVCCFVLLYCLFCVVDVFCMFVVVLPLSMCHFLSIVAFGKNVPPFFITYVCILLDAFLVHRTVVGRLLYVHGDLCGGLELAC